MKKLIASITVALFIFIAGFGIFSLFGTIYNRQIWDLTYSYEYALLSLPGGELVKGKVDSWRDFDDGDQIQVKIDGVTYLTHFANVVLISE